MGKYVVLDILKVLELNVIKQKMLALLIALPSGCRNVFIDNQTAKVRIAVLPVMEGKTCWNSTPELLE